MLVFIVQEASRVSSGIRMGQLIVPKEGHSTRWAIGQILSMHRFDLPVGPVLRVRDVETNAVYEELPTYIDFLVIGSEDLPRKRMHLVVVPKFPWQPKWKIGKVVGMKDNAGFGFQAAVILDLETHERHLEPFQNLKALTREEAPFVLP